MAAKRPASPSGKRPDDAEGLHDLFDYPPSPTDYVLPGDGTRLVRPYPFDFVMHVKKRHEGLDVVTIFAKEFPARDRAYYEKAHAAGYLRVDNPTGGKQGKSKRAKTRGGGDDDDGDGAKSLKSLKSFLEPAKVEALRPLKAGERVRHFLHRHEPPVLSHTVDIVEVTNDLVAVHKPATVPVHPTGQYRKNTVLGILASNFPRLGWLAPAHRLDRNVSGLLLLARNGWTASALREAMMGRRISKTYVALVNTKPGVGVGVGASSSYLFDRDRIEGRGSTTPLDDMYVSRSCDENGVMRITVSAPMAYDQATGVARCSTRAAPVPGAKDATTVFTVAEASESSESSGGESSESSESSGCVAVYCEPRTGRTHQIRAHLAHVGHPIANDVKYGGAATPISATSREEVMMDDPRVSDSLGPVSDNVRHDHVDPRWPLCAHCPAVAHRGGGLEGRVLDAELDAIWLHCHRYRTIGTDDAGDLNFDFTCPHPPWLAGRTLRPLGDD